MTLHGGEDNTNWGKPSLATDKVRPFLNRDSSPGCGFGADEVYPVAEAA
jgi:hypothetical protein